MKYFKSLSFYSFLLTLSLVGVVQAQTTSDKKQEERVYQEVIHDRAGKIVEALQIADKTKYQKVQAIIANQYLALNAIQAKRDEAIAELKAKKSTASEAKIAELKSSADKKIAKLHTAYIAKLNANLSPQQVEQVKDGMTYNVVPLTFANYLLQTPYLTQAQQDKIKNYLVEARELAMDGGSSKEKHAWFGKYKGRITNYLAAEGFDMKKESSDWAKRRDTASSAVEIVQSNKAVKALDIDDKLQKEFVRNLIAHQYQKIQEMQAERDAKMKATSQPSKSKEAADKEAADIWADYQVRLHGQRKLFLQKLSTFVDANKVELAQNVMTDNHLQKEYAHFQALLPNLTEVQKKQVYDYLLEARDNAMNVLDEEGRLKWFIKFRGRANNYLSKQGYNLRKATEDLEAKLATSK